MSSLPILKLLDVTLPTPEANLALDEALLVSLDRSTAAGEPPGCEVLRFWECPAPVVVLGRSGNAAEEVNLDACSRDGIPVLRRCSGGGAVVQGHGCLNFALVLSLELRPEFRDIPRSYAGILGRIAAALGIARLARHGISDLALGGRKVSGNAQRRLRFAMLHHGTLLYAFDLASIARLLREPRKQPGYRAGRGHSDFLANLPLAAGTLKRRIVTAWNAVPPADGFRLPACANAAPMVRG